MFAPLVLVCNEDAPAVRLQRTNPHCTRLQQHGKAPHSSSFATRMHRQCVCNARTYNAVGYNNTEKPLQGFYRVPTSALAII